nr:MAG: hypothetical protein DIU70_13305 [Bacillota bacterium]
MGRRKRVTLRDIAARLGISPFTVSKALSGKPGMSEETRELIIRTAQEMGYRWKGAGASPPRTVACAVPARFTGEYAYFADLLQGAEAAVREHGDRMTVVSITEADEQSLHLPPALLEASGVIYLPLLAPSWLELALKQGPAAIIIGFPDRHYQADSVVWDAWSGVGLCVDHLVAAGHRRIGYVGTPQVSAGHRLRWVAFQEALHEYGLAVDLGDVFHLPHVVTPEETLAAARDAFGPRRGQLPPALVCDFELVAVATARALSELGETGIALVCADQLGAGAQLSVPIPHIFYNRPAVGRRAVERLLRRLDRPDEPYEHIRVAVSLRTNGAGGS